MALRIDKYPDDRIGCGRLITLVVERYRPQPWRALARSWVRFPSWTLLLISPSNFLGYDSLRSCYKLLEDKLMYLAFQDLAFRTKWDSGPSWEGEENSYGFVDYDLPLRFFAKFAKKSTCGGRNSSELSSVNPPNWVGCRMEGTSESKQIKWQCYKNHWGRLTPHRRSSSEGRRWNRSCLSVARALPIWRGCGWKNIWQTK